MDKQQKIAIILLPLIAIALLTGMSALTGAGEITGAYSDGTYTGTGQGYGGDIVVTVGVSNGNIASISIDEHSETPGIGDVATEQVAQQIIETQELEVEVVTGATMSSNGVMEAVKNALAEAMGASFPDGTHEGMASGFGGDIKVTVEVVDGRIVSINFDEINETPGLGDAAAEQVAQQIMDTQRLEVEVVTGATMSSVAVMEAVSNAVGMSGAPAEDVEEAVEETASIPAGAIFIDGVYEGTAEGFMGDIRVQVEITDGKISNVAVLEQSETAGLGDVALDEVAGLMVANNRVAVETVSGATASSKAMMTAVEVALIDAIAEDDVDHTSSQFEGLTDGTFEGTGAGFKGDVKVEVVVVNGAVTSVEVIEHSETPNIGDTAMDEIIESVIAQQSLDIDVLTGATYSSEAVLEAIKNALN